MSIQIDISSGSQSLGRYSIDNKPIAVGRSSSSNIRIPTTLTDVSSKHVLLREQGGDLWIMDGDGIKASTNRVYINGTRISTNKWTRVSNHGIICLGNPSKTDCVQISVVRQGQSNPPMAAPTVVSHSVQQTAIPVPVQLTNSEVRVALVRPTRSRSQWKTPANLLIHLVGLGICIILIPAITGTATEAGIVILIIILAEIYFLPTIISFNRDQPNRFAIFALNLFLGWSLIGWVVSLIWSLTAR